jgi:alpha-L-rhamnosidase
MPENNVKILCEYTVNPLGVDCEKPRFSWYIDVEGYAGRQIAYRIIVSEDIEKIKKGIGDIWDSYKVSSGQNINIEYAGSRLVSRTKYYYKVFIHEGEEQIIESDIAWFETAIIFQNEWKAQWIGMPKSLKPNAPYFRKDFTVKKGLVKARAYISGLGYYEIYINGKKMGKRLLDPAWTNYCKRVFYSTYTLDGELSEGKNTVGIILGAGYYRLKQVIAQLVLTYNDGSEEWIITNRSSGWSVTDEGPIVNNSVYQGIVYDARKEMAGWNTPEYNMEENETQWFIPLIKPAPGGIMQSQMLEPIEAIEELKPISVSNPKPGIFVYDLGQNISGVVRLKAKGNCGEKVVLKHSELLDDDGTVDSTTSRAAQAADVYILKGAGMEVFEPIFTYHGFRYVQVEGYPGKPDIQSLIGIYIRNAVEIRSSFECSNDMLNRLHQTILWTEGDNLHWVPTDCPQRNERLGWLNDATSRAEESIYNYDLQRFYSKWIDDIQDEQDIDTGAITDTAPFWTFGEVARYGECPADPVCGSYILIPWLIYCHYNDKRILEKHYEGHKKWVNYLVNNTEDGIVDYTYYADWVSPSIYCYEDSVGTGAYSKITPGKLMSTAFLYLNIVLMSKIAKVLVKEKDADEFDRLAATTANAFNRVYFNAEKREYATGSQASNVFALYLDIVPDEFKKDVFNNLVEDIVDTHDMHLTTGNQCTKFLIDMLTELGRPDVSLGLLTQTTYPSWGYMLDNCATTIWERWELRKGMGMNSHNHPVLGCIDPWFFKYLGGINVDETAPGFQSFYIKPVIVDGIDFVNTSLNTLKGVIKSSWKRRDEVVSMTITVPWNSKAKVTVPKVSSKNSNTSNISVYSGNELIWETGNEMNNTKGVLESEVKYGQQLLTLTSGRYMIKMK